MNKPIEIYDPIVLDHIEVRPGIYHVTSDSAFDLAMTFLRTQEFYESDNKKIKGKEFSLLEYIRWYAKKDHGTSFTYPSDWGGFNVPSTMIRQAVYPVNDVEFNMYDDAMYDLSVELFKKHKRFYLIGTMNKNSEVHRLIDSRTDLNILDHELAHAFYYLNRKYKKAANELIASMADTTKNRIYKELKRLGYAKEVWDDELQAYMISGMETLNGLISVVAIQKKFRKLFRDTL